MTTECSLTDCHEPLSVESTVIGLVRFPGERHPNEFELRLCLKHWVEVNTGLATEFSVSGGRMQAERDRDQLLEQVREFRQKCDPREDVVAVTAAETHGFSFGRETR